MTWKLNCPYYHEGNYFAKIRQFWWCLMKVWPSPIITKWNFDRTVLMSLEKSICSYYHHLAHTMRFSRKIKPSLEIHLNIWPTPRIISLKFCGNIEVWLCHLKNWTVRIISHNVEVFRGGYGPATSKMKLEGDLRWSSCF